MIVSWLFRKPAPDPVADIHARVVRAALAPWLYLEGGLPDSFEGRFESLTLHGFLVLWRLRTLPDPAPDAAQDLVDRLFTGLDHTLRELGVGDVTVPKTMKMLASSFLGRVEAYDAALATGDVEVMKNALSRNALAGADATALSHFVEAALAHLATLDFAAICTQDALFPGGA